MTDDNNDFSLFKTQMKGIKPLKYDRAETGKKPKDKTQVNVLRKNAVSPLATEIKVDGLSDQFVIDVEPEEFLSWARDGVQGVQMRRLKEGQIPFEGSIDFHGMTTDQARSVLWEFLDEAARLEVRCVRVTHGKAARKDKQTPIMKSHVNTWLRQHPLVLAFSSCLAKHGGTGAVYILVKRTMLDGRDE